MKNRVLFALSARALPLVCGLPASAPLTAAPAAAADALVPAVEIAGIKDPEMRTCRAVAAGMDAGWPDDARIELTYAADETATRTADGMPRTAP